MLVGTYTGLCVYEKYNGIWKLRNQIKGFNESSRFVQQDQSGDIWISQPYKGIFRLKCDSDWNNVLDVKLFNSKNGLPSDQSNLLYRIKNSFFENLSENIVIS